MAIKSKYDKINQVYDYIIENCIISDSRFPLEMQAQYSSSISLTTNCCDSFHSQFNSNTALPKIFNVIDVLTKNTIYDASKSLKSCKQKK